MLLALLGACYSPRSKRVARPARSELLASLGVHHRTSLGVYHLTPFKVYHHTSLGVYHHTSLEVQCSLRP